jgi:hypothetical protein
MEKNLSNSMTRIIESKEADHCMVIAYNERGIECAHGFPSDEAERNRMIDNFSELYSRVETVLIAAPKEELFLEEEIIQDQAEHIRATSIRFPESFVIANPHPFNIA